MSPRKLFVTNTFRVGGQRTWIGVVALVGILGVVEIAAIAFLGHRFLPTWAAWILDAAGVVAYAVSLFAVASVLWRRHRVDGDRAHLVQGLLGAIVVPATYIARVEELAPLSDTGADQTGPAWRDDVLVLTAATGVPRVRVDFTADLLGRRLWQRRAVTAVEVSAADQGLSVALRSLMPTSS